MRVEPTALPGVLVISPKKHGDQRGFFSETYKRSLLAAHGVEVAFVQDNHSWSSEAGTIRGLHFQVAPYEQAKLVRVTRGAVLDVAVDIRRGSPSYGQHVAVRLSAADWNQLYVPVGFAHGLCTLEPDTEVLYKVSAEYAQSHEFGLLWGDPALGIAWPFDADSAKLSDKDKLHPTLADLPAHFSYGAGGAA